MSVKSRNFDRLSQFKSSNTSQGQVDDLSFYQNAISRSQGKAGEEESGESGHPVGINGQINNVLSPLKHSWVFRCQSICQGLISNS